jgi:hypothetical protein
MIVSEASPPVELETALETFTTVELIPPHSPLSEDIGISIVVSEVKPAAP